MIKTQLKIIFIIGLIFSIYYILFLLPTTRITGTYVSNNKKPIHEGPRSIDTLYIYNDGTFKNGCWKQGTYTIKEDRIQFHYKSDFGMAGFECILDRQFYLAAPRIILDPDYIYFYKKID